jgi:hypothetical protein
MTGTDADSFSDLCSMCERLAEESVKKQLARLVAAYLLATKDEITDRLAPVGKTFNGLIMREDGIELTSGCR